MKFEDCKYATYTNLQWGASLCTVVECRHPDFMKAIDMYKETNDIMYVIRYCGVFANEQGKLYVNGEDFMRRRSIFCNKNCPGFKLKETIEEKLDSK